MTVSGQAGAQTNVDPTQNLPAGAQLFWHVRAFDSSNTGPWSAVQVFDAGASGWRGGGGGGGGGSGGGGGRRVARSSMIRRPRVLCTATIHPTDEFSGLKSRSALPGYYVAAAGPADQKRRREYRADEAMQFFHAAPRVVSRMKVLSDVGPGGANGPSWSDNGFVDRSLYVPAIDPNLP